MIEINSLEALNKIKNTRYFRRVVKTKKNLFIFEICFLFYF